MSYGGLIERESFFYKTIKETKNVKYFIGIYLK